MKKSLHNIAICLSLGLLSVAAHAQDRVTLPLKNSYLEGDTTICVYGNSQRTKVEEIGKSDQCPSNETFDI